MRAIYTTSDRTELALIIADRIMQKFPDMVRELAGFLGDERDVRNEAYVFARGKLGERKLLTNTAATVGVELKKYLRQLLADHKEEAASFDVPDADDIDAFYPAPDVAADFADLRTTISRALTSLRPREEHVLRRRFGLGSSEEETLHEVGADFCVFRERIRQIENVALRKLRHPSRSRKLRAFHDAFATDQVEQTLAMLRAMPGDLPLDRRPAGSYQLGAPVRESDKRQRITKADLAAGLQPRRPDPVERRAKKKPTLQPPSHRGASPFLRNAMERCRVAGVFMSPEKAVRWMAHQAVGHVKVQKLNPNQIIIELFGVFVITKDYTRLSITRPGHGKHFHGHDWFRDMLTYIATNLDPWFRPCPSELFAPPLDPEASKTAGLQFLVEQSGLPPFDPQIQAISCEKLQQCGDILHQRKLAAEVDALLAGGRLLELLPIEAMLDTAVEVLTEHARDLAPHRWLERPEINTLDLMKAAKAGNEALRGSIFHLNLAA